MTLEVRVYAEGGGDGKDTKAAIRAGLDGFLREVKDLARAKRVRWRLTACGGRERAFDAFETAERTHPDAFNVLLVDSEAPASRPPWEHLRNRPGDGWDCPADDKQCHLMVQAMEAWLIADADALASYYGQGFHSGAIPARDDVENIDKDDLEPILRRATRDTRKGRYHKIRHGGPLLRKVSPAVVRAKAPHYDRLFAELTNIVNS